MISYIFLSPLQNSSTKTAWNFELEWDDKFQSLPKIMTTLLCSLIPVTKIHSYLLKIAWQMNQKMFWTSQELNIPFEILPYQCVLFSHQQIWARKLIDNTTIIFPIWNWNDIQKTVWLQKIYSIDEDLYSYPLI